MLTCTLQAAKAAAVAGMPWAVNDIVTLVRGGLGTFRLAHAESAAQKALAPGTPQATQLEPFKPYGARLLGVSTLTGVSGSMTPHLARSLASRGLALPLLQARTPMPYQHLWLRVQL